MNIDELSQKYNILPVIHEIIELVRNVSKKDVEFQLFINMKTDGITKIARNRMVKHVIKIKENNVARVNHTIAHECCHILRMMEANPSDRIIPFTNNVTNSAAYDTLSSELNMLPVNMRQKVFDFWSWGLIMQLTNLPVDSKIEMWLYKNYPALRNYQIKSLETDANLCLVGLSKEVEKNTIGKIFFMSNAMVYAYLKMISLITGVDYSHNFINHINIVNAGNNLYKYLEGEDKGLIQDIEIIKAWGNYLNINDWYTWIGFEDVPDSYYDDL